jgi:hypothetical protein
MAASGVFAGNKRHRACFGAMVAALLCCAVTLLGIGGFQAENRESQVAARKKVVGLADNSIEWFKTITKEFTKEKSAKGATSTNTDAMVAGMESVGKAVKEQQDKLQSGEIAAVADGQSTLISRLTGVSEDTARSWTTAFMTLAFLIAQYSCLWFAGYMRHEIEPEVSSLTHGPRGAPRPGKSGQLTTIVGRTSYEDAKKDVEVNVAAGIELCNKEYAERWNVDPGQVTRWAEDLVKEGVCDYEWRGNRKCFVRSKNLRLLKGGKDGA